ncbi:hypothetical protein ABGB17_12975 [Sphaerisporangium sp. B11E5]|uniref:hypothetical protein n=1 Tax=Sphaerisporangium sp. B11E5 TaxID=3153563 RepID=UPI00325F45B2
MLDAGLITGYLAEEAGRPAGTGLGIRISGAVGVFNIAVVGVMLGAPEELIDAVQSVLADTSGRWAKVYPTVEELTGKPSRSFDDWLADNLPAFR